MKKDRLRVVDKERFKRREKVKRDEKQKREIRKVSKEKRTYIRKKVMPYYDRFRNYKDRHILVVLKDTENMDRILLQKHNLGHNAVLLSLPVVTEGMISDYLSRDVQENRGNNTEVAASDDKIGIKELVEYYFGIKTNKVIDSQDANLTICRDCHAVKKADDLFPVNVRPYSTGNFYSNEVSTTLHGRRIHSGKGLQKFFVLDGNNLGNVYVFQDTLVEIALYRALAGKIRKEEVLMDAFLYGKKGYLDPSEKDLILIDSTIRKRFENERRENAELERE